MAQAEWTEYEVDRFKKDAGSLEFIDENSSQQLQDVAERLYQLATKNNSWTRFTTKLARISYKGPELIFYNSVEDIVFMLGKRDNILVSITENNGKLDALLQVGFDIDFYENHLANLDFESLSYNELDDIGLYAYINGDEKIRELCSELQRTFHDRKKG